MGSGGKDPSLFDSRCVTGRPRLPDDRRLMSEGRAGLFCGSCENGGANTQWLLSSRAQQDGSPGSASFDPNHRSKFRGTLPMRSATAADSLAATPFRPAKARGPRFSVFGGPQWPWKPAWCNERHLQLSGDSASHNTDEVVMASAQYPWLESDLNSRLCLVPQWPRTEFDPLQAVGR